MSRGSNKSDGAYNHNRLQLFSTEWFHAMLYDSYCHNCKLSLGVDDNRYSRSLHYNTITLSWLYKDSSVHGLFTPNRIFIQCTCSTLHNRGSMQKSLSWFIPEATFTYLFCPLACIWSYLQDHYYIYIIIYYI